MSQTLSPAATLAQVGGAPEKAKRKLPLIQQYLADQQALTAVERFSELHERDALPAAHKHYREVLPATPPAAGQQYAFEVDLDSCTGCKACVAGCHSMNGLDETETWRAVGMLHGGSVQSPVQATVTTACHHCLEPACLQGCPVDAYEKDPVTGIVKHHDDQCIGCQYCTLTCPYEVPRYNARLGIVRKCDMCSDRLKVGEAPACVQACPNGAIAIRVVDTQAVREDAQADVFLPTAPSPAITFPTTQYKAGSVWPRNLLPADFHAVRPAHQHMPLVFMLVLTQLSVGAFLGDRLLPTWLNASVLALVRPLHGSVALGIGLLALLASTAHLGRPQYAFRALIGLRRSWLSREILAFGVFSMLAMLYAGSAVAAHASSALLRLPPVARALQLGTGLGTSAAVVGLLGVFSSVMVYHVTRRRYWHASRTGFLFFGTTLLLGASTTLLTASAALFRASPAGTGVAPDAYALFAFGSLVVVALTLGKLLGEALIFGHLSDPQQTDLKRSARLLSGELLDRSLLRGSFAVIGGVLLPLAVRAQLETASATALLVLAALSWVLLLASELMERATFFSALASARMPGGLR